LGIFIDNIRSLETGRKLSFWRAFVFLFVSENNKFCISLQCT